MRGALVFCAAAALLMGCQPDELHVGMVPMLRVSKPGTAANPNGDTDEYIGVTFGTHWDLGGIEVTTNARYDKEDLIDITTSMTTVAGTLWLGWHLTYAQNETAKAWLVLRPSAGLYFWGDADNPVGVMAGIRTGVGVYLNEFNTIGLEYGYTGLQGTHGNDSTETQGLYFTYTIVF